MKESHGKSISADLTVYEASKESDLADNRMQYFGEVSSIDDHHPSSIHFSFFLPPRDFHGLLTNIQNGVLPTTVEIGLEHNFFMIPGEAKPPVSYGWEPDGSGMK
jgi:hypothetical protein